MKTPRPKRVFLWGMAFLLFSFLEAGVAHAGTVGSEFPIATAPGLTIPDKTIDVKDGSTTDWAGVAALMEDPEDDDADSPSYSGDDIKALYVAKDTNNLYIRMDLYENANIAFGNGPEPYDGVYKFIIINDGPYGALRIGVAYDDVDSPYKWSMGYNGSNDSPAPDGLNDKPEYVGVSGTVIEIKVPLSIIGTPANYFDIRGRVTDCCLTGDGGEILTLDKTPTAAEGMGIAVGAAFGDTNFLVGFMGDNLYGDTDERWQIAAQLISQTGEKVGELIPLNRIGSSPVVGFDDTNYLMVWEDSTDSTEGSPDRDIYGQFVSTSGIPADDTPFAISLAAGQKQLGMAFDHINNRYLVVWSDDRNPDGFNVYGQLVTTSNSVPLYGPEIAIATYTNDSGYDGDEDDFNASVAFDGSQFLVVFAAERRAGFYSGEDIYGRFITTSGVPDGSEFLIDQNDYPSDNPTNVFFDGTKYRVLFHDQINGEWDIFGRTVDTSGNVGSRMTINNNTGDQMIPFVAFNGKNHFLIAITEITESSSILGRFYNTNLSPVGDWFHIFDTSGIRFPMGSPVAFGGNKFLTATTKAVNEIIDDEGWDIDGDVYGIFVQLTRGAMPWIPLLLLGD